MQMRKTIPNMFPTLPAHEARVAFAKMYFRQAGTTMSTMRKVRKSLSLIAKGSLKSNIRNLYRYTGIQWYSGIDESPLQSPRTWRCTSASKNAIWVTWRQQFGSLRPEWSHSKIFHVVCGIVCHFGSTSLCCHAAENKDDIASTHPSKVCSHVKPIKIPRMSKMEQGWMSKTPSSLRGHFLSNKKCLLRGKQSNQTTTGKQFESHSSSTSIVMKCHK